MFTLRTAAAAAADAAAAAADDDDDDDDDGCDLQFPVHERTQNVSKKGLTRYDGKCRCGK